MEYTIKKVTTHQDMEDFIRLPTKIYKDNPCYVPDMESDVRDFFDPTKNPSLRHADVQAFVVYRNQTLSKKKDEEIVGRITGIINHKANNIWNTRYVRFGMIEFIDDREVSRLLIEAVEQWGSRFGMSQIQGPMGITDFDKEGMLVEDFDKTGSMVTIYNPPYYPEHLEALGFMKDADWVQVAFDIPKELPPRYSRVAKMVREMNDVYVRKVTRQDIKNGYGLQVFDLLNKAYRPLFGFAEMDKDVCQQFINQYIPLADLRMFSIVEDSQGRIIAAAITMGSLTNALRRSHGRMLPFGWWHLISAIKLRHEEKVEMLLVAVDPEYQGMGVNALIFEDLIKVYNDLGYRWAETGPMLETNQKVLTQWKPLHPTVYKRRRCFRKAITQKQNRK